MKRLCAVTALALTFTLATRASAEPPKSEPPCVAQCRQMEKRGELKPGVNVDGCIVRVCQEAGRRLYREEEHEAALQALDHLHADLALSPSYQLDLGMVYYALGRFPEALTSFDYVAKQFPESVRAGSQRGYTLIRLRRFDEARQQFEQLLKSPSADAEFRGLRTMSYLKGSIGAIQLMQGNTEPGRASLKEALDIDGRNSLAATYYHRVLPFVQSGALGTEGLYLLLVASEDVGLRRYDSAQKHLDALIEKWPKFAEAWALQSELLLSRHRYEECERKLRLAEIQLPDDVDLKARRIRCALLRYGPTSAEARSSIDEARALREQHPENPLLREILEALDRG